MSRNINPKVPTYLFADPVTTIPSIPQERSADCLTLIQTIMAPVAAFTMAGLLFL
jgi:hypothetical protein